MPKPSGWLWHECELTLQIAIKYRTWLMNEIYSQLIKLENDATFQDAKLFLYMIEGAIFQLLSSDRVGERESYWMNFES